MLRPRTAHARSKKKSAKGESRTPDSCSAGKRLADCANRHSITNIGEIIDLSSCFSLGASLLEVFEELKDYFSKLGAQRLFILFCASGTNFRQIAQKGKEKKSRKCKRIELQPAGLGASALPEGQV